MSTSKHCPSCRREYSAAVNFCDQCGAATAMGALEKEPNAKRKLIRSDNWVLWFGVGLVLLIALVAVMVETEEGDGVGSVSPPTPTTVASVCEGPAEMRYTNAMQSYLEPMVNAAPELAGLFNEVSTDPMVIFDETWREELVTDLAIMNAAAGLILELDPPASMSSVSKPADDMARALQEAVTLYAKAIDDIDPDLLLEATGKIGEVTRYMNDVANAFVRLCS